MRWAASSSAALLLFAAPLIRAQAPVEPVPAAAPATSVPAVNPVSTALAGVSTALTSPLSAPLAATSLPAVPATSLPATSLPAAAVPPAPVAPAPVPPGAAAGGGAVPTTTQLGQVPAVTKIAAPSTLPDGQITNVQVVYTQTFPSVPSQLPSPATGSIGMGSLTGEVGVVRTETPRSGASTVCYKQTALAAAIGALVAFAGAAAA
ncbi:MAG: hypothetical protein M1832_003922 [Thelocarpon impressellum]|nr:MAG: hypothetical protein M1832_003922 [Thelocarpon impressellum]